MRFQGLVGDSGGTRTHGAFLVQNHVHECGSVLSLGSISLCFLVAYTVSQFQNFVILNLWIK